MNPPPEREAVIFNAARRLPPGERAFYLEGACAGDAGLRQRVEELLRADMAAGGFLQELLPDTQQPTPLAAPRNPVGTLQISFAESEKAGDRIGRYKLLQKIGEGGCGTVYMAEQEEPVRRRVALKVIKLGMDTRSVIARFEAERQALALMDHPNIAKVFDAGATETGRPFFVMELVKGIPVTRFCDENHLSTQVRLGLFVQVCQAIQHAHQKGIIHRDIKPSNILVTDHDGVPVPKIIDFGIAKATTDQRLTDKTLFTAFEQFIGTPAYMSPEQAKMSGLDIDTRSDIYSLGVLLYELLTGKTPFDSKALLQLGLDEMRRTIREQEPVRPSTRLSTMVEGELTTTARHRQSDAPKLITLLRGDLDWIVMKALEKDRSRRYESANGLAMDIHRHLNNEPVVARPPSQVYRVQKALRRNKVVFAAIGAVAAALVTGLAVSTCLLLRERKAHQLTVIAEARAQANEKKAQQAQIIESQIRKQAQAEELIARQKSYASDMNLAQQALAVNNLARAQELLDRHKPQPGQSDLRGWEWRYLWQQCRSEALSTFCVVSNAASRLATSPDGRWLAVTAGGPGTVSIWDLRSREVISRATGVFGPEVAFSPKGSLLAYECRLSSDTNRYGVCLWNLETSGTVAELPTGGSAGMGFGDDGETLINSRGDGTLTLWRVSDALKTATYAVTNQGVYAGPFGGARFAIAHTGGLLALGFKREICVFDRVAGSERWRTNASEEFVTAVAFSPDATLLATGSGYGAGPIRLWEAASGRELARLEGHRSWVTSLLFGPDGRWLASSSGDQTIRLWDISDPARVPPPRILRGHHREVCRLALLADGKTLVSGSQDGQVCFWDLTARPRQGSEGVLPVNASAPQWAFAPDSHSILIFHRKRGKIVEWRNDNFQEPHDLLQVGTNVLYCCWSDDGRLMVPCSSNGVVRVWASATQTLLHEFTVRAGQYYCRFLQENNLLAISFDNFAECEIWDLRSKKKILALHDPPFADGAEISPDVNWCLYHDRRDGMMFLQSLTNGLRLDLGKVGIVLSGLIFSPDGRLAAVTSDEGLVHIWNLKTREHIVLGGFLANIRSVGFSGDGTRLAVSSGDQEAIKLWDTDSWQELITLPARGGAFAGPTFSPDGNVLAATSAGEVLHFWRAPSWAEIEAVEKTNAGVRN